MFFETWRLNRRLDRECREVIALYSGLIRTIDLSGPLILDLTQIDNEYVAIMGLFELTSSYNSDDEYPTAAWYMRRDGVIWPKWNVGAKSHSPLYNIYTKNLSEYDHYECIVYKCPMSRASKNLITALAHEHWMMHLLSSNTLI